MATSTLTLLSKAITLCLILGASWPPVEAQRLPTRDEDHFHFQVSHAEVFYDTKLLPDGAEVTTFLHQGEWRRFFFMVEEGDTPVSMTITPCASAIDWRLTLQDLPEGLSGDGTDADELFDQTDIEPTSSSASPEGNLLQTYSGRQAQTFTLADCPPGVLMLEMRARDRHASVKMYTTTTPHSDQAYPELPTNPQVDVTTVAKHKVTLSWKPSPTHARHGQPVEYCVAANKLGNFYTQCAVLAEIEGDRPPTAPPNAGFGFAWERERQREEDEQLAFEPTDKRDDIEYVCIGSKESYTFNDLRAGQLYFFDVFVINKNTNQTSTYAGVSTRTLPYEKTTLLKDGKVVTAHVKRSQGHKVFIFRADSTNADAIVISVQPCAGRLSIEVRNEAGEIVVTETLIKDLWKVTLTNITQGPYQIKVAPQRHRSASFKIFASVSPQRYPYPMLADDTAIRVFDRQRGCTSMVVAWLGTSKRLQYCLFIQEAPVSSSSRPYFKESNQCVSNSNRKKSEKVICRNFRYKNPRRSVMTETVRGLRPNTTYMIDVYVRHPGGRGETLSYETAWATTQSHC